MALPFFVVRVEQGIQVMRLCRIPADELAPGGSHPYFLVIPALFPPRPGRGEA